MDRKRSEVTETLDAYPTGIPFDESILYITGDFILSLDNIGAHASGHAASLIVRAQDEVCLPPPPNKPFFEKYPTPSPSAREK